MVISLCRWTCIQTTSLWSSTMLSKQRAFFCHDHKYDKTSKLKVFNIPLNCAHISIPMALVPQNADLEEESWLILSHHLNHAHLMMGIPENVIWEMKQHLLHLQQVSSWFICIKAPTYICSLQLKDSLYLLKAEQEVCHFKPFLCWHRSLANIHAVIRNKQSNGRRSNQWWQSGTEQPYKALRHTIQKWEWLYAVWAPRSRGSLPP